MPAVYIFSNYFIFMRKLYLLIVFSFFYSVKGFTQVDSLRSIASDSLLLNARLDDCIQYALKHNPTLQQSVLDQEIVEHQIKSRLADWYPQINLDYNYQHYFQLPSMSFPDSTGKRTVIQTGVRNNSTIGFSATQNLFNRDALLASSTAGTVRRQVKQTTTNNTINIVAAVSKSFYDVMITRQQISFLNEDILRLERSLKDAYSQYQGGVVDKIDYKRATIALNNARAQKKANEELLQIKTAYLKEQMGYPAEQSLTVHYDTAQMERDAFIDTLAVVNYESRIEYQLLKTQQLLQEANLKYYKWSFIPNISLFGNYNLAYLNSNLSDLYKDAFPNSYAGVKLSVPLFQGMKRMHQIKQAKIELQRIDYDFVALKSAINREYVEALGYYKSNLNDYNVLKENVSIAEDVYNTINMQYRAGIKTYLEVVIAETDLRAAQINYINALFNVLSSKIDVERALGIIKY